MIKLTVHPKRVGPIRGHHPWVFSGALKAIPEGLASGEPIELVDESGHFLAAGYFNSYSQIAVRLWSFEPVTGIDKDFFVQKIRQAIDLRIRFVASAVTTAYRIIHGENDGLPGLIVDRYGDYLVAQFHNPGIARWKQEIVAALVEVLSPAGIYERSDVGGRTRHDREKEVGNMTGVLYGEVPERITILENNIQFVVDVKTGQKTGFFLDQRDKRAALQKYVTGKKVLNCFSYSGGFSLYALKACATNVVSVDASEPALELGEASLKLNKLPEDKAEWIVADVKEYLADRERGDFDVIILDPPAFVKDRHKVKEGLVGYRNINEQALRILPPGGILVTASCSAHVSLTDFRYMLSEAAARAGRTVRIIETYTHGIDHPELVAFTEGEYLKCLFCVVY
jgi:23S rRNA (cytosine1962-C5)-methyltransferase